MNTRIFFFLLVTLININLILSQENKYFLNNLIDNYLNLNNLLENNETNYGNNNDITNEFENLFQLPKIVFLILQNIMNETNENDHVYYKKCISNMNETYGNPSQDDLNKLYEGSSKGFIELGSFYNCINSKNETKNTYNFYTVYPNLTFKQKLEIAKFNDTYLFHNSWIYGFCVNEKITDCNDDAFKEIIIRINKKFNDSGIVVFQNYYNNEAHINIINNKFQYKKRKKFEGFGDVLRLLPLILIIIQILFNIFKIIPVKLFGFFMRRKYIKEKNKNQKQYMDDVLNNTLFSLSKKVNKKIRECFSFSDNFDDLISNKKISEYFKEEDLIYIKGIKGIGILFLIFGTTYIYFFNYPICISEEKQRKEYITALNCLILIIFWRTAPALLLSASGYSLSYKFLNFLDKKLVNYAPTIYNNNNENNNKKEENDKIDKNEDNRNNLQKEEKNNINLSNTKNLNNIDTTKVSSINNTNVTNNTNTNNDISSKIEDSNTKSYIENSLGIKFYQNDISKKTLNSMFGNQKVNESGMISNVSTDMIPYHIYFNFIFRQIHKIFCILIGIHFFKYFFPWFLSFVNNGSPLMNYLFIEIIDKLEFGLGNFFYYKNFQDLFETKDRDSYKNNKNISIVEILSLIVCEVNFFILGSILIFICYKKAIAFDIIICFSILLLVIFKIIYIMGKKENNPGLFYFKYGYKEFFFNPIFNFDFYLIGMLFGMVNYVVQNDISKNESFKKLRPFVNIPIFITKACDYKKKKNIIHYTCALIFLIAFLIEFPIFLSKDIDKIIEKDNPSGIFTFLNSIDIDVFIYVFHFFIISCYFSGRNMFFKFFNSKVWLQLSKLYFWFILFTSLINYYIIYQAEAQINLGFFIVMIYGAICLTVLYLTSVIFFVILELPYKKLIKLYFNISSKINENVDEEEIATNEERNSKLYPLGRETGMSAMNELSEKELENDIKEEEEKEDDDEEDNKKLIK